MGIRFLLDEHLRGPLWRAVRWHNSRGVHPLDVVRVGDPVDLRLGAEDPDILLWAEQLDRIVVTHDPDSMPAHLADHLASGHHSPGVFLCRSQSTLPQIVDFLVAVAYASEPDEWRDRLVFIP